MQSSPPRWVPALPPHASTRCASSRCWAMGTSWGTCPSMPGVRIKVQNDAGNRGASLAKRIMTPAEVALLIRAAPSKRDRILIEVAYAGGLRVSEIVSLTWADVLPRENDLVQLSILGKGEKPRQVLLPEIVSRSLLTLRGDAGGTTPCSLAAKEAGSPRAPCMGW